MEGTSLHIKKLRPSSDCEMKMNSVPKEEITVTSNSGLSFQSCLPEDVQVTATRTIGKYRFVCVADVTASPKHFWSLTQAKQDLERDFTVFGSDVLQASLPPCISPS